MHRKLKIVKRFAGLSIIEVVIASALLAAALVPILQGLTVAQASTTKIEHKTRSLILAQAKLDEIKARSIYDYTNGGASFAENNTSGSYLCKVTDDLGDPLKTISVSVGYLDEDEVTLTTLLARRWSD